MSRNINDEQIAVAIAAYEKTVFNGHMDGVKNQFALSHALLMAIKDKITRTEGQRIKDSRYDFVMGLLEE